MSTPSWYPALTQIVADGNGSAPDLGGLAPDALTLASMAVHGIAPAAACAPESEAKLAEVVRFANAHKIDVLPRGSGTAQHIGNPPRPGALAISTRKLAQLVHHEPGDMVASVQAGMTLGAFQALLLEKGQWLPLDAPPESTIGGLFAADRSGPLSYGYGTLRDMVLGVRIVNGDGVIRKSGGRVVKNVTGYALEKLYIGSLGTLGVVTEATFRLRPLPIGRDGWCIPVADAKSGAAALAQIALKNLPLEILQLISSDTARGQLATMLDLPLNLVVAATGTAIELDRIHREIEGAIQTLTARRFAWTRPGEIQIEAGQHGGLVRFWCLAKQMQDVLSLLDGGRALSISAGLNSGVVRRVLTPEFVKQVSAALAGMNVNYRFENAIGAGPAIDAPFGPPRPEWALMKRIKTALDPQGILNAGRFVV